MSTAFLMPGGDIMPEAAKRIEEMWLEVGELKHGFGNPRKITAKKMRELESSLEQLGDFGIFIIDENKNLIGGNQRATVLCKKDPHTKVLCKMLIGYTEAELRAVNIPTRLLVYFLCLAIMLVATHFTGGLTLQTAVLAALNAFISALTAYGAYEVTFAKLDRKT